MQEREGQGATGCMKGGGMRGEGARALTVSLIRVRHAPSLLLHLRPAPMLFGHIR